MAVNDDNDIDDYDMGGGGGGNDKDNSKISVVSPLLLLLFCHNISRTLKPN